MHGEEGMSSPSPSSSSDVKEVSSGGIGLLFACKICGRRFERSMQRNGHMRMHRRESGAGNDRDTSKVAKTGTSSTDSSINESSGSNSTGEEESKSKTSDIVTGEKEDGEKEVQEQVHE